jgi:hypothetical protein
MPVQTKLPELDEEGKSIMDPKNVVERCSISLHNRNIMKFPIEWKNIPPEEAIWENE